MTCSNTGWGEKSKNDNRVLIYLTPRSMEILMTITFCFKIPSKHLYGLSVHITQIWVESVFRFSVAEFSPSSLVSRKVVDTKYVLRI